MCTTAGVHGNIAEPLPVSLSSFLISSICISLFSPWCNIQNKPRTVRLQGLTGSCMWSVQQTLISISFGSHMALERAVFSITVVFFLSFTATVYFGVFNRCLLIRDFLLSLCKLQVSVESNGSRLWPFNKTTVSSSFLFSSCGDTKAGFTQQMWHRFDLSSHSAPARSKS